MPVPELDPATGRLPVGRFPATIPDLRATFVDGLGAGSLLRSDLWEDWVDATAILMQRVMVRYAWLAGSFFSAEASPGDIDCCYWVEDVDLEAARRDPVAADILDIFSTNGAVKAQLGLRVDTFVLPWTCNPNIFPTLPDHITYYRVRGYWDDLWLRVRSGPKGAVPDRLGALPRRGYLEVILDGFPE